MKVYTINVKLYVSDEFDEHDLVREVHKAIVNHAASYSPPDHPLFQALASATVQFKSNPAQSV